MNSEFKKRNLCDTCRNEVPVCMTGKKSHIFKFGNGIGNDNIYVCTKYEKKVIIAPSELIRQVAIGHPRFRHLSY